MDSQQYKSQKTPKNKWRKKIIFFIKIFNIFLPPRSPCRTSKTKGEAFSSLFFSLWVLFALLDPDLDPADQKQWRSMRIPTQVFIDLMMLAAFKFHTYCMLGGVSLVRCAISTLMSSWAESSLSLSRATRFFWIPVASTLTISIIDDKICCFSGKKCARKKQDFKINKYGNYKIE